MTNHRSRNAVLLFLAVSVAVIFFLSKTSSGPATGSFRNEAPKAVVEPDYTGTKINKPHGGKIVNLLANSARKAEIIKKSASLPTMTLSKRQLCDIELLLNGGFSPLTGFMKEETYKNVVENLRLGSEYDNLVWPMPITLDVSREFADALSIGSELILRDEFHNVIALMHIESKFVPDKNREAEMVYGTRDQSHPAVDYLMNQAGAVFLGGKLEGTRLPQHFDFQEIRRTPEEVREYFREKGWYKIVAFQTRNPMHRAHIELTRLAADQTGAGVLIHPVVGMTKPGDVDYTVRVRCYKAIVDSGRYYDKGRAALSLLPLAMRMAGPREALWHALIRKNFGASHFVVGRDHAGCKSSSGEDFYGPYDAQNLVEKYREEIGIEILPFKMLAYVPQLDRYVPADEVPEGMDTLKISGTKFRAMMANGDPIPAWFSDPDVIDILQTVSPPRNRRGFVLFFTGLSGSGKTTISEALITKLQSIMPTRKITVLDGDVVRTFLSKGLGFTVKDRNINVERVGFVASEIAKHNGIVLCSAISPFEFSRAVARALVESTNAGFIQVHVSTSAEECARRDVKGLYEKARLGKIELTGVSHPYENPETPDLTIDTENISVEEGVNYILQYLADERYVPFELTGLKQNIDLQSNGILTHGVTDAPRLLCKPNAKRLKLAVAPSPNSISSLTHQLENSGYKVISIPHDVFTQAESVSDKKPAALESPDTSAFDHNDRTLIAFKLWKSLEALRDESSDDVVFVASKPLVFTEYILRLDPCARFLSYFPRDSVKSEFTEDEALVKEYLRSFEDFSDLMSTTKPDRFKVIHDLADAKEATKSWKQCEV